MTRGNQRDLARAKNLKKTQDAAKKNKDDGLTTTARKERDADVMRQKQQAAAAKKEGGAGPSGGAGTSGGKKWSAVGREDWGVSLVARYQPKRSRTAYSEYLYLSLDTC